MSCPVIFSLPACVCMVCITVPCFYFVRVFFLFPACLSPTGKNTKSQCSRPATTFGCHKPPRTDRCSTTIPGQAIPPGPFQHRPLGEERRPNQDRLCSTISIDRHLRLLRVSRCITIICFFFFFFLEAWNWRVGLKDNKGKNQRGCSVEGRIIYRSVCVFFFFFFEYPIFFLSSPFDLYGPCANASERVSVLGEEVRENKKCACMHRSSHYFLCLPISARKS